MDGHKSHVLWSSYLEGRPEASSGRITIKMTITRDVPITTLNFFTSTSAVFATSDLISYARSTTSPLSLTFFSARLRCLRLPKTVLVLYLPTFLSSVSIQNWLLHLCTYAIVSRALVLMILNFRVFHHMSKT